MNAHPLDIFEESGMVEYLRSLASNKQYQPPDANDIEGRLLGEVWREDYTETKNILERQTYLNLAIEVDSEGLAIIYALTDIGAFYLATVTPDNKDLQSSDIDRPSGCPPATLDASQDHQNFAKKIFRAILKTLEGYMAPRLDWDRFNAVLIDLTNPLFNALRDIMEDNHQTKQVLFVPCFSRILSRLASEIVALPEFKTTFETAIRIVRETMPKIYHRNIARRMSPAQIIALARSQLASKDYKSNSRDNESQFANNRVLSDSSFTSSFTTMDSIIMSITRIQHRLETSPAAHLAQVQGVLPELLRKTPESVHHIVTQHLLPPASPMYAVASLLDPSRLVSSQRPPYTPLATPVKGPPIKVTQLDSSYESQDSPPTPTSPGHKIPSYTSVQPSEEEANLIFNFLQKYATPVAREQYSRFRLRQGGLRRTWAELTDNPRAFWGEMAMFSEHLGNVSVRLFSVPPTSRAVERDAVEVGFLGQLDWVATGEKEMHRTRYCYTNRRVLDGDVKKIWGALGMGEGEKEGDALVEMSDETSVADTFANKRRQRLGKERIPADVYEGDAVEMDERHSERETGGGPFAPKGGGGGEGAVEVERREVADAASTLTSASAAEMAVSKKREAEEKEKETDKDDTEDPGWAVVQPSRKRKTRSTSGDMATARVNVKADALGRRPAECALADENDIGELESSDEVPPAPSVPAKMVKVQT